MLEISFPEKQAWIGPDGQQRLLLFSPRSAHRLNKLLKHYPVDTTFHFGEEFLFKIPQNQLREALSLVGLELP